MNLDTDSFENYTTAQVLGRWPFSSGGTRVMGGAFAISPSSGGFAAATQGMQLAAGSAGKNMPNTAHTFFGIRIKWQDANPSRTNLFLFRDAGTIQIGVNVNSTGQINITRGGNIATSTLTVLPGSTHFYEVELLVNNTTGLVNVWVDGVLYVTFSGDTQQSANAFINQIEIFSGAGGGTEIWMNDYYCNDTSTAFNNGRQGDTTIRSFKTATAGSHADFGRGGVDTGTNAGQLNKAVADATSFNVDNVVTHRDSFLPATIPAPAVGLLGARHFLFLQKDNIGPREVAQTQESAAVDSIGVDQIVPASYNWISRNASVDVNTSSLYASVAALNATKFGYKITV